MASQTYNVGIIGYGMSAKVFHIPLLSVIPAFTLYAIVQRTPNPDDDAEKDHPGIKSYRSTEEMVRDPNVDVVVVTTVPETHFSLTKLALENGKHVVVEKPFTPTSHEANELIALAKTHQRLLTVYQNRRYDSDFQTLLALLRSSTLGRITEFETHFDRHRPTLPAGGGGWKTKAAPGAGAVYDLGVHLIDQVVVALGMPGRVTGFLGRQREGEEGGSEDSCTVLMHYEGMMATVKVAVVSCEERQLRFWVRGVEGSYKKYHLDPQEDHLKAGRKPGDPGFGIEPPDRHGSLTTPPSSSSSAHPVSTPHPSISPPPTYAAFYAPLARALAREGEVPVKAEEARDVIRLIELAGRSSSEGRTLGV